jgi:hypothetical protein
MDNSKIGGRVALLNTSILTCYGTFSYVPASLEEVRGLVGNASEILSAVGHESTAQILTDLLEVEVPVNRIQYRQKGEDVAVVFKLKGRPEEGKILTRAEIEEIGYEFGVLRLLS